MRVIRRLIAPGREFGLLQRFLFASFGSLAVASFAQTVVPSPASPGSQSSPSVAASETPVFEVAAIKENKTGSGNSNSNTDNGRFTATNVSLKNLIQYEAYDIPGTRILGGPKWLDSARFDIEAKTDEAAAKRLERLDRAEGRLAEQAMFQQFLADRFQLKVHWATRELPVYALVAAKNGPKLEPTKDTKGNSGTSVHSDGASVDFTATGVTLDQLAQALTRSAAGELGRDVVDKTRIEGRYDVKLKWTRDTGEASAAGGTNGASPADAGPSFFTAIEEQAGLKLKPSKGPVKVLIIDQANMPSEN